MNNIISKKNILKEKMQAIKESEWLLNFFKIVAGLGYGDEINLQNKFTVVAAEYSTQMLKDIGKVMLDITHIYDIVNNIYYVTGLYLREGEMDLEEFLNIVESEKSLEVIKMSEVWFHSRVKRLKKIVSKSKSKIPLHNKSYNSTRHLLERLDKDLSICLKYPTVNANLPKFYFGAFYEECVPVRIDKLKGFTNLENTVYYLYNEMCILSQFDAKYIDKICTKYIKNVGFEIPFNLFEKVINNYLFALPYSENPEKLTISKVEAKLILNEVRMGSITAEELVDEVIERFAFEGYNKLYLEKYAEIIQRRINALRKDNYFAELFIVDST